MQLKNILDRVNFKARMPIDDIDVERITCDSRSVREGDMFVAFRGYAENGAKFIKDAISRGAGIILSEEDFEAPSHVKKVLLEDSRAAISLIADNFYNHPWRKLKVTGVTGTNGKTTVTYILEKIIECADAGAGVIGTVNYRMGADIMPAENTTPGPLKLQSLLAEMVIRKIGFAIMEVSSHSIDQQRVDNILFDAAVFTNMTSDHLDYHSTPDNYFKAKAALFGKLKKEGVAILNNDDVKVASLKHSIRNRILTYGTKNGADIRAADIKLTPGGSSFTVKTPAGNFSVVTKLIGLHNVSNILGAVGAAIGLGIAPDIVEKGANAATFAPGRLEAVAEGQQFKVFVDYAHTEDALRNVLAALANVGPRNIITVFGCGGDRDRTKRPLMGRAACELSGRVVITSDNPRFEDPDAIINEIESGIKGEFSNYEIVPDRRLAIESALKTAMPGDIVLIAGKGHEDYQIIKDKMIPFDDRLTARDILNGLHTHESKRDIRSNARKASVR